MIQLFVEGYPIDVDESFSTLITLAIDDIKDFSARNTTFSKTIIIPGTKRNNKLFGNIFDPKGGNAYNSTANNIGANFNPAISASCYIFQDNIQVVKGIFRILEIVENDGFTEYECAIFGELGGFIAKMGNKRLDELDFSAHDHTFNITNILASWDTANAGSGYYYPLIDYGDYSTNKQDWKVGTFRPALYAKEYIEKIFALAGYSFDSTLISTDRFKRLIVPNNTKRLTKLSTTLLNADFAGTQTSVGGLTTIEFDTGIGGNFTISTPPAIFTYNAAGPVSSVYYLTVRGNATLDGCSARVGISVNGTIVAYAELFDNGGVTNNFFVTIPYSGDINNTDVIRAVILEVSVVTVTFDVTVTEATFDITTVLPTWVNVDYLDDIEMNSVIPKNYLQKDFISSIMKLFNLYLFEDTDNEKLLYIQPFVEFYEEAGSVDWSLKVERSKAMKYTPMSELNSRYFSFNMKDDSDYYNELYKKRYNKTYGSYKYDSEYEFANETTNIDVMFSGSPLVGYAGEDKKYTTIIKRTGESTVIEERVDSNIRLLLAKKITGVASYDITDSAGTTVLSAQTAYGYAGHMDDPDSPSNDLNFGVPDEVFFTADAGGFETNQFNVYWSPYMAEITDKDSRLLTCTMKLSYRDIYDLSFKTLVWIDGVLYRLNKITDFNVTNEDTCKVELLKVINRIY